MGLVFNGDSDALAMQKVSGLVAWCRTGEQFLKALDDSGINLQFSAKTTDKAPTHYQGGAHGGTMYVNLNDLNLKSKGKQAATVLHELFHCVHRLLDVESYKYRNTIGGEAGKGLGGWAGNASAEEQLAITGHLVALGKPNKDLRDWVEKGFCENRVLRHLGYPLRNSHA